jgi:hypothetical protein
MYVDDWNSSDLYEVTSSLGKDREHVLDLRGPRSLAQQLVWLKRSMRENDIVWYDVNKNVTVNILLSHLPFYLKIYIIPISAEFWVNFIRSTEIKAFRDTPT